jgi:asparagine synthase (glutamine-hydrolysing)
MCGFSGAYEISFQSAIEGKINESLAAIKHRGPDDEGIFRENFSTDSSVLYLASSRLAVLDLTQAAHMPMQSSDGRYTIAYNGEITNFLEIRHELEDLGQVFSSHGDTEVLLKAWEIWHEETFPKLEGMFAFAIYDAVTQRIVLARDSFGIKPLFYSVRDDGSLYFSSELPGLLPLLEERPRMNLSVAYDFVRWGVYDSSNETFVENVFQLRPAHFMTFDIPTKTLGSEIRYWSPSVKTNRAVSRDEAATVVRNLLLESIDRNLRSDVPVGVALSGGVDSSAIVCAIRHLHPKREIKTFSYIANGFEKSEEKWVDFVARSVDAHSHKVTPEGNELLSDLDEMIVAQGEPFGSTSIYAQYRVFKLAQSQGMVVTLDGQGADEIFGGYIGFPELRIRSLIEKGRLLKAKQFLENWSEWPGRRSGRLYLDTILSVGVSAVGQITPKFVRRMFQGRRSPVKSYLDLFEESFVNSYGELPKSLRKHAESAWGNRLKPELRSQLSSAGLPALLRHGDRNAMAFSIESRVPFLDRKLVEYCLSLPEDYLVSQSGETKSILREALRGIAPDEILDRRDKIGFETPEHEWLSKFVESNRLESEEINVAFLNSAATTKFLTGGLSPSATLEEVRLYWRIVCLLRWIYLFDIDSGSKTASVTD